MFKKVKKSIRAMLAISMLLVIVQTTISAANHFAQNGDGNPINTIGSPHGAYYNNRTYVSYQGPTLDPYVTYYDHEKQVWGPLVRMGHNFLGPLDDNHGSPTIAVDSAGYIHVIYGGHAAPNYQIHAVSDNPEDISSWHYVDDIDDNSTYAQLLKLSNGSLYFIYRDSGHGSDWKYSKGSTALTGNPAQFSKQGVSFLNGSSVCWYVHSEVGSDDAIHMGFLSCIHTNPHQKHNAFYMKLTEDAQGNPKFYNADEAELTIPLNYSDIDTNNPIRAYNSTGASNEINGVNAMVFREQKPNGEYVYTPHLFGTAKTSSSSGWAFKHFRWDATSKTWIESKVDDSDHKYDKIVGIQVGSTLQAVGDGGLDGVRGGSIMRWVFNGTSWTHADTLLPYSTQSGYIIGGNFISGNNEARAIFAEGPALQAIPERTGHGKVYLWGISDGTSGAFVQRDWSLMKEAETCTANTSAGDSQLNDNTDENHCSNDAYNKLMANGAGDFIEYTIPIETIGNYRIFVGNRLGQDKGKYQLSLSGTDFGSVMDQYNASSSNADDIAHSETYHGIMRINTTGNYLFKFAVTGKNISSSDYDLGVDYIRLEPTTESGTLIDLPTVPVILTYECEGLTVHSFGANEYDVTDSNCSAGAFSKFDADGINDYVEYTVNVPKSGTYVVKVRYKTAYKRGIYQLSIDGTNQGTQVDQYTATSAYKEQNAGDITFSTAGNKTFRFIVVDKNVASGGYKLAFDYIQLEEK